MSPVFPDKETRKWLLQVLLIILIFGLLAWMVWLYYDYHIHQTPVFHDIAN